MNRHKPVSCFALIAVKYTRTNSSFERKRLFVIHILNTIPMEGGKKTRHAEAGTEAGGIDVLHTGLFSMDYLASPFDAT